MEKTDFTTYWINEEIPNPDKKPRFIECPDGGGTFVRTLDLHSVIWNHKYEVHCLQTYIKILQESLADAYGMATSEGYDATSVDYRKALLLTGYPESKLGGEQEIVLKD